MATHNVGPTDANPSISDGDTVIYGSGEHTVVRSIDTTGFTIGIDIQLHPNAKIHAFETLTGWVVHSGNVWKKTSWSRSPINTGGTSQSGYNAQKSIDLLTQSDSASDTFNWFVHRDSLRDVALYRDLFPDLWIRATRRLPELLDQATYAHTTLYREGIQRIPGMTWKQTCYAILEHMTPERQPDWQEKIERKVGRWNKRAATPFPEEDLPGVPNESWKFMCKLVSKNDLSGRDIT